MLQGTSPTMDLCSRDLKLYNLKNSIVLAMKLCKVSKLWLQENLKIKRNIQRAMKIEFLKYKKKCNLNVRPHSGWRRVFPPWQPILAEVFRDPC